MTERLLRLVEYEGTKCPWAVRAARAVGYFNCPPLFEGKLFRAVGPSKIFRAHHKRYRSCLSPYPSEFLQLHQLSPVCPHSLNKLLLTFLYFLRSSSTTMASSLRIGSSLLRSSRPFVQKAAFNGVRCASTQVRNPPVLLGAPLLTTHLCSVSERSLRR